MLNETAARKVLAKIEELERMGLSEGELTKELIDYAYAVAATYGEGSAAAACEMYDALAEIQGAKVPPAIPADPPSYRDVAKTVNGTRKFSQNPNVTADGISRLVKRTGVDTTVNNAIRDGAEWAWIPHGDTCAFCLMLASRGWQKASKKALKNGHAEHIHAHCDCTYAVRFDSKMEVEGYDPDALRDQYYAAEGNTPQERINSMRRANYAENRERIISQKREAYSLRKNARSVDNTSVRGIMIKEGEQTQLISQLSNEEFAALFQEDPLTFRFYTPITLKKEFESRGFDINPLGRGKHKGQPFENGGGYIVRYSGDGIIEYHPAKGSRHGGRYYKTSDAKHGRRWFDMNGNEIDIDDTGKSGTQVLKEVRRF